MTKVRAKKWLGQHFLVDENIALKTAESLTGKGYNTVLEIGPGMGVLTKYLLQKDEFNLSAIEVDTESVNYLLQNYPQLEGRLIEGDFLRLDLQEYFKDNFAIVGNFPYNISSQIMFKLLDYRNQCPELVGMFQKEVAERFSAKTRTKAYGILSVLLQTYYNCEYLFTVPNHVFDPPPKVESAVVRLIRNERTTLPCDEVLYKDVIKTAFQQRRKKLSNAIKKFNLTDTTEEINHFLNLRAEELTVEDFIKLTLAVQDNKNND